MRTNLGLGRLFLAATLVVLSGCHGVGVGTAFNAATDTITPGTFSTKTPIVIETMPTTDVAPNRFIYFKFSHDMNPATLNPSTVYINGVTSAVTYDAVNRKVFLKPTNLLATDFTYNVTLTTGVRDTAGAPLPIPFTFAFHTRERLDASTPFPVPVPVPIPGCVPLDGPVAAQFDENMNSMTINTSTFLVQDVNDAIVAGTVTYDDLSRIATFVPSTPLIPGATYTATLTTDITDLGGNHLASDFVWMFTVCEAPPPPEPDFCTGTSSDYGDPTTEAGQVLQNNYTTIFFSGLTTGINDGAGPLGFASWSNNANGLDTLTRALSNPSAAPPSRINTSGGLGNFTSFSAITGGTLNQQTVTLTLNIGFSGTNSFPPGFDQLIVTNTGTSLDGSSILDILGIANLALGGAGLPEGYTFESLTELLRNINASFDGCVESEWAAEHLVEP